MQIDNEIRKTIHKQNKFNRERKKNHLENPNSKAKEYNELKFCTLFYLYRVIFRFSMFCQFLLHSSVAKK